MEKLITILENQTKIEESQTIISKELELIRLRLKFLAIQGNENNND